MESFGIISKLMLVLGIAGGLYTFVYALWVGKSGDGGSLGRSPDEEKDERD
jgi:hypothetical protein